MLIPLDIPYYLLVLWQYQWPSLTAHLPFSVEERAGSGEKWRRPWWYLRKAAIVFLGPSLRHQQPSAAAAVSSAASWQLGGSSVCNNNNVNIIIKGCCYRQTTLLLLLRMPDSCVRFVVRHSVPVLVHGPLRVSYYHHLPFILIMWCGVCDVSLPTNNLFQLIFIIVLYFDYIFDIKYWPLEIAYISALGLAACLWRGLHLF